MHDTVIKLLDEVKQLWMATDSLKAFTDWPHDLIASNRAPNPAPAAEKIMAWRPPENSETSPLVHAVQQAAFHVNWQFIYTEEEVGRHFLDNYAYFELIGPTGHFRSDQCCAFIGYWGRVYFTLRIITRPKNSILYLLVTRYLSQTATALPHLARPRTAFMPAINPMP